MIFIIIVLTGVKNNVFFISVQTRIVDLGRRKKKIDLGRRYCDFCFFKF
jgi:hypothetical protein